jgi:hypothetical protein
MRGTGCLVGEGDERKGLSGKSGRAEQRKRLSGKRGRSCLIREEMRRDEKREV